MYTGINKNFPAQKKSTRSKDNKWREQCVDAGESILLFNDTTLRKSRRSKRINYDLYSDILDQSDIERMCNPLGVLGNTSPAKIQNYPICNPKIDLLEGEARKRKFDWKVRINNEEVITDKEEEQKARFEQMLIGHLQSKAFNEETVKEDLKRYEDYKKYEYQDLREKRATIILKDLWKKQRVEQKLAKGFKDALICGEEIYQCDIVAGEPVLNKLNPKNVYTIRSGESPYIEDSDIIVIVGFLSPGALIDEYHDELTGSEIDMIERRMLNNSGASNTTLDIGEYFDKTLLIDNAIIDAGADNDLGLQSAYDLYGNIRRTIVLWKSMRKVLKVKYYDEQGDEQYALYDENYKIDRSRGEEAEELWINEWWEGHKIGGSINSQGCIYKRMRVKPFQIRQMENPSKCHPGIIGTIYNTNDNQAVSLMDRMKPFQYLYNIFAYTLETFIAKHKGAIMPVDLAKIPEGWTIDKWLSYAWGMNIAVLDSFKEGEHGNAEGKLAGQMQSNNPVLQMNMAAEIQTFMMLMQFIKQEMGEISGVSQARQAQISTREAVSNVEREISQSSNITEYWFAEHDFVKIRVLETLLEVAKVAWKDKKNLKRQFVLDDGSTILMEMDSEFCEMDYGIIITDGSMSAELVNQLKGLAQAGLQNQMLTFSQLIDIYTTDSISSIRRKLERAEDEKIKRDQQAEQNKQAMQSQALEAQSIEADKAREFQREEWDREDKRNADNNETKLKVEQMRQDLASAMNMFHSSESNQKITLDDIRENVAKLELEAKKLEETKRHNKAQEEIDLKKVTAQKNKPTAK